MEFTQEELIAIRSALREWGREPSDHVKEEVALFDDARMSADTKISQALADIFDSTYPRTEP